MIEIKIYRKDPSVIMEIVRELRSMGLVQGRDFDFAYKPPSYDSDYSFEEVRPKHTVFTFHTEKYATLFTLKYGHNG